MLEVINLLTFFWIAFWTFHAITHIVKGNKQTISFVMLVYFIFIGLPLGFDVFIGQPEYISQPGFKLATQDTLTSLIYCLYVSAIPVLWWMVGYTKEESLHLDIPDLAFIGRFKLILHLFLVSPLIIVLLVPEAQFLNYAWFMVDTDLQTQVYTDWQPVIMLLSMLSLLSVGGLLASIERIRVFTILYLLPWVSLAIWVNGKRYIFVFALAVIWFVLWYRGYIKRFDSVVTGIIFGVILLFFSFIYQENVRSNQYESATWQQIYENFRVDFGRDDVIKMTIYAEIYPEQMQILEYRGQSILFYLTMYIPREWWPDKPYPYTAYFTSAMLRIESPRLLGWGMTTSWLEEAIANFSWFGMIIGPLLPVAICRISDSRRNILASCLGILVASLFLVLHMVAFAPVFFLWILIVLLTRQVEVKTLDGKEQSSYNPTAI